MLRWSHAVFLSLWSSVFHLHSGFYLKEKEFFKLLHLDQHEHAENICG